MMPLKTGKNMDEEAQRSLSVALTSSTWAQCKLSVKKDLWCEPKIQEDLPLPKKIHLSYKWWSLDKEAAVQMHRNTPGEKRSKACGEWASN